MASISSRNRNPALSSAPILARKSMVAPGTFAKTPHNLRNHEGGQVYALTPDEELRRTVLSCLLWERSFYESGESIVTRITRLVPQVDPQKVSEIAYEARTVMKLRHVPLLIAVEMLQHPEHKKLVRKTVGHIVQRADEAAEILMLYWASVLPAARDAEFRFTSQRRAMRIPEQLRRGIKDALAKFDDYQITKYLEKDKPVTMADVIRMVHPNPNDAQANLREDKRSSVDMAAVYKSVVDGTARAPDTWESQLSAQGKDAKKEIFTDLLTRNKLPAMALLRNLRGMTEAGVDQNLVKTGLANMNVERVLPYRFVTAARYAPQLKDSLQDAMFKCVAGMEKLPGRTILLIDVSPSMKYPMSRAGARASEMVRLDGAVGLSILAREICEEVGVYLFDFSTYQVTDTTVRMVHEGPHGRQYRQYYGNRIWNTPLGEPKIEPLTKFRGENLLRGFALDGAIRQATDHGSGTDLEQAVDFINQHEEYDRIIVFTDDESTTVPPAPKGRGYAINVSTSENGVTYGPWIHINGFSEGTLAYISEYEQFLKQEAEAEASDD